MTHQNKEGLEAAIARLDELAGMRSVPSVLTRAGREFIAEKVIAAYAQKTGETDHSPDAGNMVDPLLSSLREENERLRKALEKVDAIRNSIIGFQNVGWSDHIYPLVAALEEAEFEGKGYDVMRTEIRTMLEAERQLSASQAQLKIYREALERVADIMRRNFGRQNEKLADIEQIARTALSQEAGK